MLIPLALSLFSLAAPPSVPEEEQTTALELEKQVLQSEYQIDNSLPPLYNRDDPRTFHRRPEGELPIVVPPFEEHRREWTSQPGLLKKATAVSITGAGVIVLTENGDFTYLTPDGQDAWHTLKVPEHPGVALSPKATFALSITGYINAQSLPVLPGETCVINDFVRDEGGYWFATSVGLFRNTAKHPTYGSNGPLSTTINALARDSRGNLWIGTPLGLSVLEPNGGWRHLRGKDGLPYEDITALAIDVNDRLWIGTSMGVIHYRPYEVGRQWYYRQGPRYLPHDRVNDIAVSEDGNTVYLATEGGLGILKVAQTTLLEKAETIEKLVNVRHRRLGLVASATLDNAVQPTSHTIGDNDNDGLWTAYHVAALSMAYSVTGSDEAKRSAKESMDAIIMLQNASGTPGLVARSVVPPEIGETKGRQWRPTPDGTMYWKSDTSSDEIDGHYLAFYTYWEHIARKDDTERARIQKQVRDLTDYLVDNNYLLIDWDGEHTRWGFWQPAMLNDDPSHYLENGLNALQMLSFLKVAHHITGDEKYNEHYQKLMKEHGYLNNVLLEKKVFPDENNHSDNQLAYVAWYPILQLEQDPLIRLALKKAVRRHYRTLERDRSSLFYFVTATVDPDYVDIEGAIQNLREIPTDRRMWPQLNGHRADLVFDPYVDRFGKHQLITVLPADERQFDKWNRNPYVPDSTRGGETEEDDGAAYLLPYWIGRFHGFLKESN